MKTAKIAALVWLVALAQAQLSAAELVESSREVQGTNALPPVGALTPPAASAASTAVPRAGILRFGQLDWHTDYTAAYHQAQTERKQLLLFFRDDRHPELADSFERGVLAHADLHDALSRVVRVILPLDALRPQPDATSKATRLLDHSSFEHMYHRQGLAMIDLVEPGSDLYGQVVSAHPFTAGKLYTVRGMQLMLGLPRASLTQRALIYAVRLHPEAPPCTNGVCHPFILRQARQSSSLMAQYQAVGHHDWGNRSAEITAATNHNGMEVAAMSMGSTSLIDAAIEIVNMWQGSPTHWGMMTAPCSLYGFDMVRAAGGGSWYGTGILAN